MLCMDNRDQGRVVQLDLSLNHFNKLMTLKYILYILLVSTMKHLHSITFKSNNKFV